MFKKYKFLTEASGSLTAGYLIKAIKSAGHICVASDITTQNPGRYIADEFILMPHSREWNLWQEIIDKVTKHEINIVIPSLDETLLGWATNKELFKKKDVHVIVSPYKSIEICLDKWKTFAFFETHGIPTPKTSLEQEYGLIKPRFGRGSQGIYFASEKILMDGKISQETIKGNEFTVDVFCDSLHKPIYIVPRRRLLVKDGKSTSAVVELNEEISFWIRKICSHLPFVGPINIQCFLTEDGSIKFLEINPRIAGGMALGFAATENWITLIVENLIHGLPVFPKQVKDKLRMERFYEEVFVLDNPME